MVTFLRKNVFKFWQWWTNVFGFRYEVVSVAHLTDGQISYLRTEAFVPWPPIRMSDIDRMEEAWKGKGNG